MNVLVPFGPSSAMNKNKEFYKTFSQENNGAINKSTFYNVKVKKHMVKKKFKIKLNKLMKD